MRWPAGPRTRPQLPIIAIEHQPASKTFKLAIPTLVWHHPHRENGGRHRSGVPQESNSYLEQIVNVLLRGGPILRNPTNAGLVAARSWLRPAGPGSLQWAMFAPDRRKRSPRPSAKVAWPSFRLRAPRPVPPAGASASKASSSQLKDRYASDCIRPT
jgi:hypothetical protein